jgi:zinc transport system ATP-binding protein
VTAALKVEHLSFSYSNLAIFKDVSFEIAQKECVGIIGPNGGGKSTLLKLICGFLAPTEGTLEAIHPIAYVPQTLGFDKQFPISTLEVVLSGRLSHLTWFGTYRKGDIAIAEASLEKVGLADKGKAPFCTLSGGQLQRALIARALASEPKLMLLDEPTASVDQKAEEGIFALLKELKEEMTLLLVTHDLNQAIHQVDRLLVIQHNVVPMTLREVCEHFALGLYHAPLTQTDHPTIQIGKPHD